MPLTFWDRALERLTEGEPIVSVCTGEDGLPSLREWWARCDQEPEFLNRAYSAAVAGELIPSADEAPPPRDGRRNLSYTPEQFEAALDAIRAGRPYCNKITEPGIPSHAALDRYRKRNPDYDRRMREALAQRGFWVTRKVGATKPKAKPRAVTAPPSFELRRKLLQNEFYRVVDAAVPRGLPEFIRDDVRSEMVADLIAGDLQMEEVKAAVGDYLSDHYAMHDVWRDVSMDAPVAAGATRTFGDYIDAEAEHF